MAFYDDMATVARELIDEFGTTITLTAQSVDEIIDPVTGVITPGVAGVVSTPKGIVKSYTSSQIDGTRILASDRLLVLDDTIEPSQSDKVTASGEEWHIVDIQIADPAGTALVYFVQIRK